jgi:hypothetical protein
MSQDRRTQFDAIQIMIKNHEFDKARMHLEALGGPKAQKWIDEINERHPPIKLSSLTASKSTREELPPELRLDEMDEIKEAIREKRYDDAEALLILSDHPEAEKLRHRLAAIRGGRRLKTVYVKEEPDFTGKLALSIILLLLMFIPGLIALEIFAREAKQYPHAPGAEWLLVTRKVVWFLTIISVVIFGLCALMMYQTAQWAAQLSTQFQATLSSGSRRR